MLEMPFPFLGQEGPLEKEMVTSSSIPAWNTHGQRSLEGYSPWGLKRVRHELAPNSNEDLALRRPILRAKAVKFVITEQVKMIKKL